MSGRCIQSQVRVGTCKSKRVVEVYLNLLDISIEDEEAREVHLRDLKLAITRIERIRGRSSRISRNGELSLRGNDVDVTNVVNLDGADRGERGGGTGGLKHHRLSLGFRRCGDCTSICRLQSDLKM